MFRQLSEWQRRLAVDLHSIVIPEDPFPISGGTPRPLWPGLVTLRRTFMRSLFPPVLGFLFAHPLLAAPAPPNYDESKVGNLPLPDPQTPRFKAPEMKFSTKLLPPMSGIVAALLVVAVPAQAASPAEILVAASLANGAPGAAEIAGGVFTGAGWQPAKEDDHLYYGLPEGLLTGTVEVEVKGIRIGLPGDPRKHRPVTICRISRGQWRRGKGR